ncbi:MAG: TatD family hydrolase [Atopobiaceae bacterium]|nr:TatD family hydrolase [Atopobiaceae bacterium]
MSSAQQNLEDSRTLQASELYDMHCHLDFFEDPAAVAADAQRLGLGMFAVSVTPQGYEQTLLALLDGKQISDGDGKQIGLGSGKQISDGDSKQKINRDGKQVSDGDGKQIRLGVGAHPWWIADGRCSLDDIERVCELMESTRFIGELGLDFSNKHTPPESHDSQIDAFRRICTRAGELGGKLLSIHAVRSAHKVLDILETSDAQNSCDCIFHWFSGSTDELWRAIRAGCYFSVNEMMLATKRSREYLKLIPHERLLLETDLPPQERASEFCAADIRGSLERALARCAEYRGVPVAELAQLTAENSTRLLA